MLRTESVGSIGVGSTFMKDEYNLVSFGPGMMSNAPKFNKQDTMKSHKNSLAFNNIARRTGIESDDGDEIVRLPNNNEDSIDSRSKPM
jgi:hypothetical protein